jgi:diacylglycerol kinase (ATP)
VKSALLIVNPASRGGAAGELVAVAAFRDLGVAVDVVLTEATGHAARIAGALADSYETVFTLGGDGTAMEVVGALVGRDRAVGILPGGTGNQIARHLGTSLDISTAARQLVRGIEQRMDLGKLIDGRRFALTAGFGLDAAMMHGASPALKKRLGVGAYLLSSTRALFRNAKHQVRAVVDGAVYERECGMAMIANVPSLLNGLIATGPDVSTTDGLLDLCLFTANTPLEAFDVVRRCTIKDFRPHRNLLFVRGREISLETLPPSVAQVDGELIPPGRLDAIAEPGAARLLTPAL